MSGIQPYCTDPSHPPVIRWPGQKMLYERVSKTISEIRHSGVPADDIARLVSGEFLPILGTPSDGDAFRLQQMRQQISRDWRDTFYKLDNLGHLVGWFINDCQLDEGSSESHHILGLFGFEAVRIVFAVVNQLRSALPNDTFVYLRTLHEAYVKSRFLVKFSPEDPDLAARLWYHTDTMYWNLYNKSAPADDPHASTNMWATARPNYGSRFHPQGGGQYDWAFPFVKTKNGSPKKKPNFHDLKDLVDGGSSFSQVYYDVSTSKNHAEMILNPLMVQPEGRGTSVDSFSVGHIGLVMDLMLPLYEDILENAARSCSVPDHGVVMSFVRTVFRDIEGMVDAVRATNPDMHLAAPP